ncbi:hypothetical protein [Chlorobium sp.]|uniref:hypothetical protein n=1 Tax=Chlorobium sp. TaxID=1095 RepID=UPI0025BB471B|nr:hypothetical protein [Chlorobium sp.]MCF8386054.1 hypothetical protein [Chlorobium sp.]
MTHNVSSCRLLAVLTRNPVSGKVKTRLAAAIGNDAALMVYETLREYTAEVTNACNAGKAIFYSDEIPKKDAFLHNGTLIPILKLKCYNILINQKEVGTWQDQQAAKMF